MGYTSIRQKPRDENTKQRLEVVKIIIMSMQLDSYQFYTKHDTNTDT